MCSVFVSLREKAIPFETRPLDLEKGEQRNPSFAQRSITAKVPAIEHDGFWLTESMAILEYIEERFPAPQHPPILPATIEERARARQLLGWLRFGTDHLRAERPTSSIFFGALRTPLSQRARADADALIRFIHLFLRDGETTLFSDLDGVRRGGGARPAPAADQRRRRPGRRARLRRGQLEAARDARLRRARASCEGLNRDALPPHHGAGPRSRRRAALLLRGPRPARDPPPRRASAAASRWSSSASIRRPTRRRSSSPTTGTRAEAYTGGRNFGHVAYEVEDIYAACQRMVDLGYTINRPPRDGRMAFVRSPDLISVELLQRGEALRAARAVDLDAEHRRVVTAASWPRATRAGAVPCAPAPRPARGRSAARPRGDTSP